MRFEITDVPSALGAGSGSAGEACALDGFSHRATAVAIARGVDIGLAHRADIGSTAEKMAEMAFLITPGGDFNGRVGRWVGIDDSGRFERIDHAERTVEPARKVLTLEMGACQELRPGFPAHAEHVADTIDVRGQPRAWKLLDQPPQRAHMRLGKCWPMNAAVVGADFPQCVEIRQHPGTINATKVGHAALPSSTHLLMDTSLLAAQPA